MTLRTNLADLALDFRDKIVDRAENALDDEKKILEWAADRLLLAHDKLRDGQVSEAIFQDWLRQITLVQVPAKTGALAKAEARALLNDVLGGVFKSFAILAGAL